MKMLNMKTPNVSKLFEYGNAGQSLPSQYHKSSNKPSGGLSVKFRALEGRGEKGRGH